MVGSGYKLSATIAQKYAPLVNRSHPLHEQTPKAQFPLQRNENATNIDLWVDGAIYPHHPDSCKRPSFRTVSEFLEFVGEGKKGLLGYIESLCSADVTVKFKLDEALRENQGLHERLLRSLSVAEERDRLLHFTRAEMHEREVSEQQNRASLQECGTLRSEIHDLKLELNGLKVLYDDSWSRLNANIAENKGERLQLEVDFWIDYESSQEKHLQKLSSITSELKKTKATLKRREAKINRMVKTPYGYRSIVRNRRDLHTLAANGGQAKRSLRLARSILLPSTTKQIQGRNHETGSRQRLCGNKATQTDTGKILASLLSREEVASMCTSTKLSSVGVRMANYYMEKIGNRVNANDILETCDRNGITHKGYGAIYNQFKGAAKLAGKGLRIGCLPNPHRVSVARQMLNLKLQEYVGEYYSINDTLEILPTSKAKTKEHVKVSLNNHNSLFVDVEQVQRTMVELYDIKPEELEGRPLIFVLKLDEAEIVHGIKMERVSLTLMNRALDERIDPESEQYFSVQSEREIWPIASFQVPRETHEILKWVFSKTKIPELIKAQEEGQLLEVPSIGLFHVEWHLAADMKTIKCMYGLKMGANSLHSCIYCDQERVKPVVGTIVQAATTINNRKCTWKGGLFSSSVSAKPLTGASTHSRWKPILQIPLDRVHICTLHAMNRIIEKIVHLHFMHIWTIRDPHLQKQAITEMEKTVSLTGAHGGNVIIFKDDDLSGKNNNVPNKPSFSGAHAMKLFAKHPSDTANPRPLYIDVVNSEKNYLNHGQAKRDRLELWKVLDNLRPYFSGLRLTTDQSAADFSTKIEEWGRMYIKCFGEGHITHYMHVIIRHASYFLKQYGSLAVWSCQGMENSHHAAKTCYQRHTQHAGGKHKKSPLVQIYQHWYRIIAHRFRNKEITSSTISNCDSLCGEQAIATRRETSLKSSAAAHTAIWRAKCTRVGSRWVPNLDTTPI